MLRHSASPAVAEGVALLQGGSMAVTHGRHGKPRPALFVLSADERTLSWESRSRVASVGRVVRRLTVRESSTSVQIADVQALRIGSASLCLEDADTMGDPALSLCLVFGAGAAEPGTEQRPTLDLSFEDDETFGLWVAALRALFAHDARCGRQIGVFWHFCCW